MIAQTAGSFTLPGSAMTLNRVGNGATQLAGARRQQVGLGASGDIDAAIAVCENPSRVA